MGVIPVKACRELPERPPNMPENPAPSKPLQSRRKRLMQIAREETDRVIIIRVSGVRFPPPLPNPISWLAVSDPSLWPTVLPGVVRIARQGRRLMRKASPGAPLRSNSCTVIAIPTAILQAALEQLNFHGGQRHHANGTL
jgi:hypothetical protein